MDEVIKMLVKLFDEKGMTENEMSNCIASLWGLFCDPNVKRCRDLNHKMREAGWQDFEIDEKTFKMASLVFSI